MGTSIKPLVLIILDGWGYREEENANAIAQASTPTWDDMWSCFPHALLEASGPYVGLPDAQMGNSEVGHLTIGAGRVLPQDLMRIDNAIKEGDFFENEILVSALKLAKEKNKAVHMMGLLSPGGVHSHERHLHALVSLASKIQVRLFIHAFLDGRDTPPHSALNSLVSLERHCEQQRCGEITSLIGRYYAMDRNKHFDRIQQAYDLIACGKAPYHYENPKEALLAAYARGETDEFVKATAIHPSNQSAITIHEDDVVVFMNFRADRARELTQVFIDPTFNEVNRQHFLKLNAFVCLTEYDKRFNAADVAFPSQPPHHFLAECLSKAQLKQLRLAETEKYAHVTFFLNGGIEVPYPLEDRLLIPSPKVATYDLKPEMSAPLLTHALIEKIYAQYYDVIICNFANADMVGHSGDLKATVRAIETIDASLGKIITALKKVGGAALITADHGNAEKMFDEQTKQAHTAHTSELVPFIYAGYNAKIVNKKGTLADIAPTMLYVLKLPKPDEMTGKTLIRLLA